MGLLRIKPYSKITVTELCRLADINRGTFYIHYFDVDDVLDDIVTESFSDVSQTGCLTINRLMLQNNCRDWHNVQQTIDRFIRAGLQEFLQDGE